MEFAELAEKRVSVRQFRPEQPATLALHRRDA